MYKTYTVTSVADFKDLSTMTRTVSMAEKSDFLNGLGLTSTFSFVLNDPTKEELEAYDVGKLVRLTISPEPLAS